MLPVLPGALASPLLGLLPAELLPLVVLPLLPPELPLLPEVRLPSDDAVLDGAPPLDPAPDAELEVEPALEFAPESEPKLTALPPLVAELSH